MVVEQLDWPGQGIRTGRGAEFQSVQVLSGHPMALLDSKAQKAPDLQEQMVLRRVLAWLLERGLAQAQEA